MEVVAEDNTFDPFLLFPEEVWKLILEKLKDTTDVLNMFTAYPKMKNLLVTTRHLYLFELILPYVADWVNEDVILNCRQVCKHWYNAVNHLVENQPSLRAYDREAQLHCQNWNPSYYSKAYYNGKEMEDPSIVLFKRYFRWRYSFHNQLTIQAFISDFEGFPQDSNPFMGRSVVINRYPWGDQKYVKSFWENALQLLRGWGKHIWFLEVWQFVHQEPYHFAQCVQQTLHLCPNLRSIYLEGNIAWTKNEDDGEDKKRVLAIPDFVFPDLPHLETLKIGDGYPELIDTLIRRYSFKIRRLVWSTRSRNWKEEYGELFPILTEFILAVPVRHSDIVSQVIMSMKCPKLYRLYLGFRGKWDHSPAGGEIGNWKKHFPNLSLKHFGIACELV